VPEPAEWMLLTAGLFVLGFLVRVRRRYFGVPVLAQQPA